MSDRSKEIPLVWPGGLPLVSGPKMTTGEAENSRNYVHTGPSGHWNTFDTQGVAVGVEVRTIFVVYLALMCPTSHHRPTVRWNKTVALGRHFGTQRSDSNQMFCPLRP